MGGTRGCDRFALVKMFDHGDEGRETCNGFTDDQGSEGKGTQIFDDFCEGLANAFGKCFSNSTIKNDARVEAQPHEAGLETPYAPHSSAWIRL